MTLREDAILETLSLPSAYSFCASMMMRTLSLGEAAELGAPRMSCRKERGWEDMFRTSRKIKERENVGCEASSRSDEEKLDGLHGLLVDDVILTYFQRNRYRIGRMALRYTV